MDYSFDAKQDEYRAPVWAAVDRICKKPRALRRVAILDTAQALETRHLLALGYRPENILVVNRSAAQLAALTLSLRRDGIEGVKVKAGEYCEVLVEWPERIDVMSFDTTSNLGSDDFVNISASVAVHRPCCLVEVMLAGREGEVTFGAITDVGFSRHYAGCRSSGNKEENISHMCRVRLAAELAVDFDGAQTMRYGKTHWSTYRSSSGQQMVWFAAQLLPIKGALAHPYVHGRVYKSIRKCEKAVSRADAAIRRVEASAAKFREVLELAHRIAFENEQGRP